MSYGLMVYRADLTKLRLLYGSHDPEWLLDNCYMADDDEMTVEQALDEIVRGQLTAGNGDADACQYGYALEMWCGSCGVFLNNDRVMPWNSMMDLPEGSVLGRLTDLAWSGPPLKLPAWYDFPTVGHLDSPEIGGKLAAFEALDLSGLDAETRAILEQYGSWLRDAHEYNQGLITFYH